MDIMERSKIYLFANNRTPSDTLLDYVSNLNIGDDDITVVFNGTVKELTNELPKIDYACFCGKRGGFHGVEGSIINQISLRADKYIFRGGDTEEMKQIIDRIINRNNITSEDCILQSARQSTYKYKDYEFVYPVSDVPGWPGVKKLATTGFHYMFYFLNKYPDHKIVLVGFNLKGSCSWHDFKSETSVINELVDLGHVIRIR
jgi:hypothetical protein